MSPKSASHTSQSLAAAASSPDQTDILRKQFDRLQIELQDAYQEIEVCKKRRDWAFSERDKIVQERESIRTLCDKLRRERDRKVSDLAEALRESDEIKRQKNETVKELQELKEKLDLNNKGNGSELMTPLPLKTTANLDQQQHQSKEVTVNPKMDFACQTVLPTVNGDGGGGGDTLQMVVTNGNYFGLPDCQLIEVRLKRSSVGEEWGFKMKVDDAFDLVVSSLRVSASSSSSSSSSSQLRIYDQLVAVNDVQVASLLTGNVEKKMFFERAEALLGKAGLEVRLQVRRRRLVRTVQSVRLPVPATGDHHQHGDFLDKSFLQQFGFDAECALIVNRIDPHSTTLGNLLHQNVLDAGDRIIAINGNSLNNLFGKSLVHFLMQQPKGVEAQVVRFVPNQWAAGAAGGGGIGANSGFAIGNLGRELSICVDEHSLPSFREVPPMMTPPPPPPLYLLEPAVLSHHTSDLHSMSYHLPTMALSPPPPPPPPPPLIHSPNIQNIKLQTYEELSAFADHHQQQQLQQMPIIMPSSSSSSPSRGLSKMLQLPSSPPNNSSSSKQQQHPSHQLYSSSRTQHLLEHHQPSSMRMTTTTYDESKAALQKAEENLAMKSSSMHSTSHSLTASQHLHLLQLQEQQKELLLLQEQQQQQQKHLLEQQQQQQHKQQKELALQQELRQENEQRQAKLHLLHQQKLLKHKMQLEAEQQNSAAAVAAAAAAAVAAAAAHQSKPSPGLSTAKATALNCCSKTTDTTATHPTTAGKVVDCSSSDEEEVNVRSRPSGAGGERGGGGGGGVNEENDADADDDASTTTDSDTATEDGTPTYTLAHTDTKGSC